jgi:hypothetical protein
MVENKAAYVQSRTRRQYPDTSIAGCGRTPWLLLIPVVGSESPPDILGKDDRCNKGGEPKLYLCGCKW